MADTRVQLEVEDWVRENYLSKMFGKTFHRERMKLNSGGVFDFDAVSADRTIVAAISTSASKTSGGKHAVGKFMKLRSDMLFLIMAEQARKKLIVLTDRGMHQACLKEKQGGRVPKEIDFIWAEIPAELEQKLVSAREKASKEVSPRSLSNLPDSILMSSDLSGGTSE